MSHPPSDEILNALRLLTDNPKSEFRDGQREAIEAVAVRGERVLLVQRTGWGKSAVYFISTRFLRDQGLGPTLLISPLLALMRNQIAAARRLRLRTYTINSSPVGNVDELVDLLEKDEVDLLIVSPERLANPEFASKAMPLIGRRPGLTVVDEVHCISDWGHDFRPDYRRLGLMITAFATKLPVIGCTATANNRVVSDAQAQLGADVKVYRGPLGREGLSLHVLNIPEPADRLAWLKMELPNLPGSGIVYCLTTRDVDVVAEWLAQHGVKALPYHGGLDAEIREVAEQRLISGELKVLVATSALGMGYDNPKLGFVVHYQAPRSVVHYYQQVGRAGRALTESVGVLLRGAEDAEIQDFFIDSAFPSEEDVAQVISALERATGPLWTVRIEKEVNIPASKVEQVLKQLDVEGVVRRVTSQKYERTLKPWVYPRAHIEELAIVRHSEQAEMERYSADGGCRMEFLASALDDDTHRPCGLCDNCAGPRFELVTEPALVKEAEIFLNRRFGLIEPRKQTAERQKIPEEEILKEGRYLCRWGDAGHGQTVRKGKQDVGRFDDSLINAALELIAEWNPQPPPTLVTFVPSSRHPRLVADFAERLAESMGLPFVDLVERSRSADPQKTMRNSAHQANNVVGAFAYRSGELNNIELSSVLLVDDIVDSRWTLTEVGRVLLRAGCGAVFPLALACSTSKGS